MHQVDIVRVLADVARALVRLHAAGHVHRDVKAGQVESFRV
jgi:serine/threonine-protein kinase 24/25/MST4